MDSEEYYSRGYIDLSDRKDLFPSVTVVTSQDTTSAQVFIETVETQLTKDEFNDFKVEAAKEGNLLAPEALAEMETFFQNNDILYGVVFRYRRTDTIAIDITTDDDTNVKNRLYDLVSMYITGKGGVDLQEEENLLIKRNELTGNRSGTYNVDFGRVLRGATLQVPVDYIISQVYYDTNIQVVGGVQITHGVNNG
jgi:hypothetical protein